VRGRVLASAVLGVRRIGGAAAAFRTAQGQWGHVQKTLGMLLAILECVGLITKSRYHEKSLWLPSRRWPVSDVLL
jgi:hypothetical protein